MADPIVPNFEYSLIDGQVVTIWASLTSGGATTAVAVNLPTYAPHIDVRIGHPVLSMISISDNATITGTETFLQADEVERGVSGDSTGEWSITDYNTVDVYNTPNVDSHLMITYIAFGGTRA
jgi:hypothetical protein